MEVVGYMIKRRDELMFDDLDHKDQRKSVRAVFKDNGFDNDDKTNVEMKLQRHGFVDVVSV